MRHVVFQDEGCPASATNKQKSPHLCFVSPSLAFRKLVEAITRKGKQKRHLETKSGNPGLFQGNLDMRNKKWFACGGVCGGITVRCPWTA
ncbi:hypothetical protein COCC4DRAFT_34430, partial [Bipolaris maydis ATCC 48331]